MKRIDTINARENMFGVGKSGFHDNADLQGQDATYVSPEWFNTVQEELCNLLELRGIALSPDSKRQLYDLLTTQTDLEALAAVIEEAFIRKSQIIDNLTTNDETKPVSAAQAKVLQDKKLDKDDVLQFMPIAFPKSTPPSGYLTMMGQAISQVTYPKLFDLYGSTLPDMRAYTIRGLDYGRGIDVGRVVLSEQQDEIKAHTHDFLVRANGATTSTAANDVLKAGSGGVYKTTDANGGAENRVKNIAFLYIVKAG